VPAEDGGYSIGEACVDRDPSQYAQQDDTADARLMLSLIDGLLLRRAAQGGQQMAQIIEDRPGLLRASVGGAALELTLGDIVAQDVDAVINAVNE
jgi:hypothetical protein